MSTNIYVSVNSRKMKRTKIKCNHSSIFYIVNFKSTSPLGNAYSNKYNNIDGSDVDALNISLIIYDPHLSVHIYLFTIPIP